MDAGAIDLAAKGTDFIDDHSDGATVEDTGVHLTNDPAPDESAIQDAEENTPPSNSAGAVSNDVGAHLTNDDPAPHGLATQHVEPNGTPSNSAVVIEDTGSFSPAQAAAVDSGDAVKETASNSTRATTQDVETAGPPSNSTGAAIDDAEPLIPTKHATVDAGDAAKDLPSTVVAIEDAETTAPPSNSTGAAIDDAEPLIPAKNVTVDAEPFKAAHASWRPHHTEIQQNMTGSSKIVDSTEAAAPVSDSWDWAYENGQPPPGSSNPPNQIQNSSDCIIVDVIDLTDDSDDAHGRPGRGSKTRGSLNQARDSHVGFTMKALDELGDQVQRRDGGKRTFSDFLETEERVVDETIELVKELYADVKKYRKQLKKARV
jgi:hypothetical protein